MVATTQTPVTILDVIRATVLICNGSEVFKSPAELIMARPTAAELLKAQKDCHLAVDCAFEIIRRYQEKLVIHH